VGRVNVKTEFAVRPALAELTLHMPKSLFAGLSWPLRLALAVSGVWPFFDRMTALEDRHARSFSK
jgi:hypothetical protein